MPKPPALPGAIFISSMHACRGIPPAMRNLPVPHKRRNLAELAVPKSLRNWNNQHRSPREIEYRVMPWRTHFSEPGRNRCAIAIIRLLLKPSRIP